MLKPPGPPTGTVDGGWWPRSRDLAAETPDLFAAVGARLGPVDGVSYHLEDWNLAPRKIVVGGARVRLAGYHSQRPNTVDVRSGRELITLLVVPPGTSSSAAASALEAAGDPANTDGVEALFRAPTATATSIEDAGEQRWESDGGTAGSVGRS